jgi:hypothetical protein
VGPRQASELFDDVEEQLEYMDDYGFDVARIHVLEHRKRYADAAAVALGEQDIPECIRLLLRSDDKNHLRQALSHAIHGLWMVLPYGSTGSQLNNPAVASLLEQVSKIDAKILNDNESRQVRASSLQAR